MQTPSGALQTPLLAGALGFGAGVLAHYLMQRFEGELCGGAVRSRSASATGSSSYSAVELPLPLRETKNNPSLDTDTLNRKQNLDHVNFSGKRVLMRVDYNVKIKGGKVVDATRITSTIPTLKRILEAQGEPAKCIVLITHLGRPAGNIAVKEYTVEPIVSVLRECLPGVEVQFLKDCVGEEVEAATKNCKPNTVFLCENLRFHPEETGLRVLSKPDGTSEKQRSTPAEREAFKAALSRLGDVFVFEAFGAAHRPHASIVGINLPQRVAGLLMHKEMDYYGRVLSQPARPFLAIIGGAKVSDKILVLENMLSLVDEMIIGGGMAYTFLKVINGVEIGDSLFDKEGAEVVHRIVEKAKAGKIKLHLPVDHIIGDKFGADAKVRWAKSRDERR